MLLVDISRGWFLSFSVELTTLGRAGTWYVCGVAKSNKWRYWRKLRLPGYGCQDQLLVFQDFVEAGLVGFDYALIGEDGLLVLYYGRLVGKDCLLIG
jgi:hypothetical protein